jgi:acyl-CoA reductase-like NAD-dependent aldehyde dehydrogenase
MVPCLTHGNSAVHKPSEWSPLSIRVLCYIFEEAGLPPGVYNMVHGFGPEAGVPLVEHPDIIGVYFIGSPGTARDIAVRAAPFLKRTSFELGENLPTSSLRTLISIKLSRPQRAVSCTILGRPASRDHASLCRNQYSMCFSTLRKGRISLDDRRPF